jgi:hypothetical protein
VGEVAESEGVAAQGFQAPVDGFGGAVGGVVVEEGRISSRRRDKVRPSWAISSNPAGTPRRMEAISLVIAFLPRGRFGSAEAAMIF